MVIEETGCSDGQTATTPTFQPIPTGLAPLAIRSSTDPGPPAGPIFVHSSFRTSSTWLWHKLRGAPGTIAYYEVFHEVLATLDLTTVRTASHDTWRSKHPASAPYYLEFLPLLNASGGVANYEGTMAFESFIPAEGIDGCLSLGEWDYLDTLIRHAQHNRCVPVLTCTRSLGRAKAIGKAFPGTSIFLHRNLFHQWASYCSLALSGNPYFMQTVSRIVSGSRHDPAMRMLHDWFGTRASVDDMQSFQLFLLMHLYLYAHAYDAADIVVDVSAIAGNTLLRQAVEKDLSTLVAHPIDLSDVRTEFGQSRFDVRDVPDFTGTIDQFMKLMSGGVSEASLAFIDEMRHRALEEWRRHEFFTREFRQAALGRADTPILREEGGSDATMARYERDQAAAKLADAKATQGMLQRSIIALNAERDGNALRLIELAAERDRLQQEVAALTAERG